MLLIREFEPEAERQYKKARIGGYCHLATGQEAATVGAVAALRDDDYLLASYRDHGLALARGVEPACGHGRAVRPRRRLRARPRRLDAPARRRPQLPRRLGHRRRPAAASRPAWRSPSSRGDAEQAVLCELGDGATNIGAWHESLNLAGVWRLPIVFLVMNNVYGMGTSVERASAEPELYKRAAPYRMRGERVDGDDLEAVIEASEELLANARATTRARGARADDLPLPRPLGRRRRARLPHEGRDLRAPRERRPDRAARPHARRARAPRRRRLEELASRPRRR